MILRAPVQKGKRRQSPVSTRRKPAQDGTKLHGYGPRMKVTATTPRRLMIDHAPWALGIGTIAALLVMLVITWRLYLAGDWAKTLVAGACTILFPGGVFCTLTREQLILDRDKGMVTHRERNLMRGYHESLLSLATLREVQLRVSRRPKREPQWRLLLRFEDRGTETLLPFPRDWGLEADARALKSALDTWLAAADPP
jgi:hypothetical protein